MHPLEQLLIIGAGTLVAHWIAARTRLTAVLWYLFMGAVFVNVGWLEREPGEFIEALAELGIIIIMFTLGFEESADNFMKSIKRSWGIALFGGLAPFLTAYSLTLWFWDDQRAAILSGLAMTATAVSLTLVSLKSEGLQRSRAATGIMTSALLDDLASLVLVAVIVPTVVGAEEITLGGIGMTVLRATAFFVLVVVVGRWVLPHDVTQSWARHVPLLRHFGIRHLIGVGSGGQALLVLVLLALGLALVGELFGLHPAVGAYMAGLILREEYFPQDEAEKRDLYRRAKSAIEDVAFVWIGPIFFFTLGGQLEFDTQLIQDSIGSAVILFLGLMIAQILSAGLAARYTAGFRWEESTMVGLGMLGRAELAFVVMGIAHVQYDVLNEEAFYTLMLTAFLLNIMVPVTIHWWKPWFEGDKPLPGWMQRSQPDPDEGPPDEPPPETAIDTADETNR